MLSIQPCWGTLRTELSCLERGDAVAQAYAVQVLARAVAAAAPYAPTSITARPRPTTEAVSVTLQFAGGYRLQVTTPYPQANQPQAPKIILSLFHYERLQYAQAVPGGQVAAHIAGALYPLS
ncbi:hypothetical protein GCM10011375_38550 [Hymenobacter qilianensis]|uniref:Uncharacterized protein n=2 Tax=Hymenobacter qilianensis TaxID=1385715 RepID=A0ACB5PWY0_9BACT|nr:hypothetical protein [Hymenobacter qilianensis]QNP54256.1 hypothetical protein H9L05_21530 [Hymenobacter qilianensis]GGF79780.1 hypothetical protein GCM10011375_38550 [Hymenobacter qilianensis]